MNVICRAPAVEEPEGYKGPMGRLNDPQFEVVGICHKCRRQYKDFYRCEAFPKGIPGEILKGDFIHVKPYPGDNGKQFISRTI